MIPFAGAAAAACKQGGSDTAAASGKLSAFVAQDGDVNSQQLDSQASIAARRLRHALAAPAASPSVAAQHAGRLPAKGSSVQCRPASQAELG